MRPDSYFVSSKHNSDIHLFTKSHVRKLQNNETRVISLRRSLRILQKWLFSRIHSFWRQFSKTPGFYQHESTKIVRVQLFFIPIIETLLLCVLIVFLKLFLCKALFVLRMLHNIILLNLIIIFFLCCYLFICNCIKNEICTEFVNEQPL